MKISVLKLKGHKLNVSCNTLGLSCNESRPVTREGFVWLLLNSTRAGRSRLITWHLEWIGKWIGQHLESAVFRLHQ